MKGWGVKRSGFTIVELLIVIVVIGILATIVLVSYGVVVNNANDAAVKSDFEKIDDTFKQYALDHGGLFPDSTTSLAGLNIKLTESAYSTSNAANVYECLNPAETEYAIIAMSRSGNRFYVRSESGVSQYNGSVVWDASTINQAATCADINSAYVPAGSGITGLVGTTWQSWVSN